jgi:hypothetical protein
MRKTIINLIVIIFSISLFTRTFAVAQTASPTNAIFQQQINDLKNKIASRVAELNLVEKRGIAGVVTYHSDVQINLTDLNGNSRIVDVDELTNFSSNSKSFGISDIKNGQMLSILGLYNKQSKRILARKVEAIPPFPQIIYGGVGLIDDKNFEITVIKENGVKAVIEVQDITKTFSFTNSSLTKSGFSKITSPEAIIVIGNPDEQNADKILAQRIILLPEIDITNRINFGVLLSPTVAPSTGSGIKLYPIK